MLAASDSLYETVAATLHIQRPSRPAQPEEAPCRGDRVNKVPASIKQNTRILTTQNKTSRSMERHSGFLPVWSRFQMSVRGSVVLIQGLRGMSQFLEAKAVMLGLSEMRLPLLHCTLFPVNHLHVAHSSQSEIRRVSSYKPYINIPDKKQIRHTTNKPNFSRCRNGSVGN